MRTYARIYEGAVAEIFSTDGDMAEMFHPDLVWADITDVTPEPVYGWTAVEVEGAWSFAEPVVPAPTDAELRINAIAQRDALLAAANEKTAGMADAYIAGLLDADDTAMFKTYAAYKLDLNKIDTQAGYPATITWPPLPA